jgi:hypothetical protein
MTRWLTNVEQLVEWELARETCFSATSPTINSTRTAPELNPNLRRKEPSANLVRYAHGPLCPGGDVVKSGIRSSTSGRKLEPPVLLLAVLFIWLIFQPWRWRQSILPKRWWSTGIHYVATQKTTHFKLTAVRKLNPTRSKWDSHIPCSSIQAPDWSVAAPGRNNHGNKIPFTSGRTIRAVELT